MYGRYSATILFLNHRNFTFRNIKGRNLITHQNDFHNQDGTTEGKPKF